MKKTIEVEICDLCKQETKTQRMAITTYRTFDSTDGQTHYSSKKFCNEELDLCEECLEKITVVHSIGVQCNDYTLGG